MKTENIINMFDDVITRARVTTYSIDICSGDAELLKKLVERNEPKLATQYEGYTGLYDCPVCGKTVSSTDNFCAKCGQRIYKENKAL